MALHSEYALLSGSGPDELSIESESLQNAVNDLTQTGLGCDVDLVPSMAIISLVGRQLRSMVGISGRFFSTLGENGINIEMISQGASEINISCVIEEREANRALNVVHTNLFTFLDKEEEEIELCAMGRANSSNSTPQLGGGGGGASRNTSIDGDEWQRRRSAMYRRESNLSEASFIQDVDMAQD
ncbi:hypothetical protein KC346_g21488, partial [Hortaea werneckii]